MNYQKKAKDIWEEIKTKNLGEVTAVSLIEQELKRCILDEREEIVEEISKKFAPKPIKFNWKTYLCWILHPKVTMHSLMHIIKVNTIGIVRGRNCQ